jgi:hypothetical protein
MRLSTASGSMNSVDSSLKALEEITVADSPIALSRLEPDELAVKGAPKFRESFDDLDYLKYSCLTLPSERPVALVRHRGASVSGTKICIAENNLDAAETVVEALKQLGLSIQDLSWIHPEYEDSVRHLTNGLKKL